MLAQKPACPRLLLAQKQFSTLDGAIHNYHTLVLALARTRYLGN